MLTLPPLPCIVADVAACTGDTYADAIKSTNDTMFGPNSVGIDTTKLWGIASVGRKLK
jgi:hypothetical protein